MGDSAQVRLVRCPKCQNLLPELPAYSVYQCGACGAVLLAKKSDSGGGRASQRSDEARDGVEIIGKGDDFRRKLVSGVENGEGMLCDSDTEHGDGSKKPIEKVKNGDRGASADQLKPLVGKANVIRGSDGFARQKGMERRDVSGVGRMGRGGHEAVEFVSLNDAGEGTSRCYMNGSIGRNQNELENCDGVESARPDREELLRKVEELKEQLSKSCDVNEKHKEKEPVDMRMFGPESHGDSVGWFPDHTSAFRRGSRQMYAPDEHGMRSNYVDHYHEPYAQGLSHVHAYENEFQSHLYTRPPHRRISDPFDPHSYKHPAVNQFACSCYHCYYKHSQHEERISPTVYGRHPSVSRKLIPPHLDSHGPVFRQGCNSRISHFASSCHHRAAGTDSRQRSQRPMAGGAPFVTCHDCNELLELPKKTLELDKSQWKIRCGGCSSVISFSVVDEKLTPVNKSPKQAMKGTDALDSSGELLHGRPYDPHRGMRRETAGFHSEDYESSAYDFPSAEREPGNPEVFPNPGVLSSSTSEDEVRADNFITVFSPLPQCLPLEEHFDHSSTRRVVNQRGKGSLSSRSDQERILPSKNITLQNSMNESPATELDVPRNEYSNTGVSHDTHDTSGEEEDLPKGKRGVDSFFAGVIKKSFRDISKSNKTVENGKGSVSINGHLMPDRLVKKAEKLAGPISPGQYWYDVKAGFWGVMGRPCHGIIPPHIEEFNYPMPQNSSCGNTGVFVNGRELHSKDLDLLALRGLPVTRDRSYIIEISGEVVDEDTGEELDSLGKLAPTVEKVKHGFGMRVPEATS